MMCLFLSNKIIIEIPKHLISYFIICINLLLLIVTASSIENTWTVQRNNTSGFSSIACDQTIEQTLNRDSKTSGGMVGFTLDRKAMHKWIVCHAEKAAIVNSLHGMTNLEESSERYNV